MPIEILPCLWIGNKYDSLNIVFLKEKEISLIINATKDYPFNKSVRDEIECIRIPINDTKDSRITENIYLYENIIPLIQRIHKEITQMKSVLIHCIQGKQRSPSIAAAYIMYYGKVDMKTAIKYIVSKSADCFNPSINFKFMLDKFEKRLTL